MKQRLEALRNLYPDLTQAIAAELLGVSRQRVNQICKKHSIALLNGTASPRPAASYEPRIARLYRCFDAENRLLYVGVSMNPVGRIAQHATQSCHWSDDIVRIDIERRENLEDALIAEAIAIRDEKPIWNQSKGATLAALRRLKRRHTPPHGRPRGMTDERIARAQVLMEEGRRGNDVWKELRKMPGPGLSRSVFYVWQRAYDIETADIELETESE